MTASSHSGSAHPAAGATRMGGGSSGSRWPRRNTSTGRLLTESASSRTHAQTADSRRAWSAPTWTPAQVDATGTSPMLNSARSLVRLGKGHMVDADQVVLTKVLTAPVSTRAPSSRTMQRKATRSFWNRNSSERSNRTPLTMRMKYLLMSPKAIDSAAFAMAGTNGSMKLG